MIKFIEKVAELKEYKLDTLFLAVNITDRYLVKTKPSNRIVCFGTLAICCLLIAAKLMEPMSPNFNNMCKLLDNLKVVEI